MPAPDGFITPVMLEQLTPVPLASSWYDWVKAGLPDCGQELLAFESQRLCDWACLEPHSIRVVTAPPYAPLADTWAIHKREQDSRPLVYMYQLKDHATDTTPSLTRAKVIEELVKAVGWERSEALLGEQEMKQFVGWKDRLLRLDHFLKGCDVLFVLVTDKNVPEQLPYGVVRATRQQLLGCVFGPSPVGTFLFSMCVCVPIISLLLQVHVTLSAAVQCHDIDANLYQPVPRC